MKNALMTVAFAFLAGTLVSSLAQAQDASQPPAKSGDAAKPEGHRPGPGGMLDRVGATAEQKAKAEAIMKEAHEKAQKAETPEEKMKIIREAMENIRNNVLTEEQRAKMPKPGEGRGPGILEKVGATPEQKAKAEAIMKEAREKAEKAESREDKMKIMKEAMENVRNNVLTEEQRAKMPKPGEGGRGGQGGERKPGEFLSKMLEGVGATAEQKAKAEEIMKAAHEKAQKAENPEDKGKIMREAFENVRNNVLTEEQRAKMPKPGQGGRGGHGGPGGPGGGQRPTGGPGGAGGAPAGGGPAK